MFGWPTSIHRARLEATLTTDVTFCSGRITKVSAGKETAMASTVQQGKCKERKAVQQCKQCKGRQQSKVQAKRRLKRTAAEEH